MARFPNRFLHLIEAPGEVDNYKLFRMEGTERISEPFSFDLTIRSQGAIPKAEAWIDAPITFAFGAADNAERKVNGRCAEFRHLHEKGSYVEFAIVVRPAFERLKLTRDRRIFNDQSAKQVIETVLGEHRISFDDSRYGTSPKRSYIVQHDESDFALVNRLMEDEGIFHYFKYDEGAAPYKHRMIIAGTSAGYYDGQPFDLAFRRDHLNRGLSNLQMGYASAPAKVVTHDYNFKQPDDLTPVTAPSRVGWAAKSGQVFQWGAGYRDPGAGRGKADLRVETAESGAVGMRGEGTYSAFAPGARFNVDDQKLQPWERRIVVQAVRHSAFDPYSDDEGEPSYRQTFEAHPSTQVFRPQRTTPRAVSAGPQTAVVLDQNDAKGLGRVKVRFHWDHTGHSSSWVRVLQQWGGNQIGAQFVPRPGMEVLVDFIDGRADNPVVVGCLYNGKNKAGFELPANLSQQGWRTGGSGGLAHHLLFEDKGGGEKIDLHSGRDLVRSADRDDTAFVKRNMEVSAKAIDLAAGQTISIHVGRSKITISDAGIWIDAPQIHLNSGGAPGTFAPTVAAPPPTVVPTTLASPAPAAAAPTIAGLPASKQDASAGGPQSTSGAPASSPMGIDKTLGADTAALATKSPQLQADMEELDKDGWTVRQGEAGKGSYVVRNDKQITIDGNKAGNAQAQVQTLAHEVGHARYPYKPDFSTKDRYVAGALKDEGAAVLGNIRDQRAIIANGGPDIGISGSVPEQYNRAYDDFLKAGDVEQTQRRLGSILGLNEKASTSGQNYIDMHSSWYDEHFPPKK